MRAFSDYIRQIPIPAATPTQREEMLVKQVLAVQAAGQTRDVAALEAEIDAHIYWLYGLTEEEIAVVEESVLR